MTTVQSLLLLMFMVFVLGTVVGSFLNVCIYRIPAGVSIVSPRSRCPKCETPIPWYLNIPILSWVLLRGKCAQCKNPISVRYPLIEALNGLLFALVFYYFFLSWATPVFFVFMSMLVVITFIDLDHQIIPNVISLPGIVLGFFASFLIPWVPWVDSLLGIALGGGLIWGIAAGYRLLMGVDGMGMGDAKLLAMIGAFLGWQAVLPVVFIGSIVGSAIGVPFMFFKGGGGKFAIPFGPFLSLGAVVYLFWWGAMFDWYITMFFPMT
jgi:leader peptidase (prepilin peptidase)/N-methyltransferase